MLCFGIFVFRTFCWCISYKNSSFRLINPAKNELCKVRKLIIEKINKKLISELHLNQSKNTDSVLKWLTDIFSKRDSLFIQLEFNEFYPSINEDILTNVIRFAKLHIIIDDKNLLLNMHCVENPYCVAMKLGNEINRKLL